MRADQRVHLHAKFREAINYLSVENDSNTPDWMLADYLISCLDAWNATTQAREKYYGRDPEKVPVSQWPNPGQVGPGAPTRDALDKVNEALSKEVDRFPPKPGVIGSGPALA